jgi:hypothetical protein
MSPAVAMDGESSSGAMMTANGFSRTAKEAIEEFKSAHVVDDYHDWTDGRFFYTTPDN